MMETSVDTPEWCEILIRTCDLMMRNLEEMLREPFDTVDVLVIYICKHGARRSEELRMAATGALQAMGGNVVMSKQLCGRPCVWGAHRSHHRYNVPAAAPCRYCSCNEWTKENYRIFANCVLKSARRTMNHTIGKASAAQPSASAVTDRSLTADPADHPLSKTNSSVPRPPPPPTPEEDPDVLRQQAASALSRVVECSRIEARKSLEQIPKNRLMRLLIWRRTLLSNALIG